MLEITYNEEEISLDRFFETLVYRHIIDSELTTNERSILLFITRKTIGFDKLKDNIGFKEFTWNLSMSEKTIRKTIAHLINEGLLHKEASKGGKTDSRAKYSMYMLGNDMLTNLIDTWIEIKEENGFYYNS